MPSNATQPSVVQTWLGLAAALYFAYRCRGGWSCGLFEPQGLSASGGRTPNYSLHYAGCMLGLSWPDQVPSQRCQPCCAPAPATHAQPEEVEVCRRPDGSWWQLGSGACGTVYKGLYHGVQPVAVKMLHQCEDGRRSDVFMREVTMLKGLRDRNIVQVCAGGQPCLECRPSKSAACACLPAAAGDVPPCALPPFCAAASYRTLVWLLTLPGAAGCLSVAASLAASKPPSMLSASIVNGPGRL
jgi:hypothetical protein